MNYWNFYMVLGRDVQAIESSWLDRSARSPGPWANPEWNWSHLC